MSSFLNEQTGGGGGGTIGGSIGTNQIGFGSSANTLAGSSNLTWTNSTSRLSAISTDGSGNHQNLLVDHTHALLTSTTVGGITTGINTSYITGLQLIDNNVTWQWPTADGTIGQALVTDGAGNLSFSSPSSTLAATHIGFGSAGNTLTGNADLTWNETTGLLNVLHLGNGVFKLDPSNGVFDIGFYTPGGGLNGSYLRVFDNDGSLNYFTGGTTHFSAAGPLGASVYGDDGSAGNNTQMRMDDGAKSIWFTTKHQWYVQDASADQWLMVITDAGAQIIKAGDISGIANNTLFTIDDAAQTFTFSKLAGVGTRMVTASAAGVLGTASIPSGTVGGTGTSGQATFWSGTSTISGDTQFLWDNTAKNFQVGDIAAALSTKASLEVNRNNGGGGQIIAQVSTDDFIAGDFYNRVSGTQLLVDPVSTIIQYVKQGSTSNFQWNGTSGLTSFVGSTGVSMLVLNPTSGVNTITALNQINLTNPAGHSTALFVTSNHGVSLGDVSSTANKTRFVLTDSTKVITLQSDGSTNIQDSLGNVFLQANIATRQVILGDASLSFNQTTFTVDDVNQKTFTNRRFETGKGANIASANNLTLGSDGNVFTITGNTQLNAITIANWQAGSHVTLIFTGTPTVKHNTAGGAGTAVLLLAGSIDLTAANNTVLGLVYDGTQWQETFRKVA